MRELSLSLSLSLQLTWNLYLKLEASTPTSACFHPLQRSMTQTLARQRWLGCNFISCHALGHTKCRSCGLRPTWQPALAGARDSSFAAQSKLLGLVEELGPVVGQGIQAPLMLAAVSV